MTTIEEIKQQGEVKEYKLSPDKKTIIEERFVYETEELDVASIENQIGELRARKIEEGTRRDASITRLTDILKSVGAVAK